MLNRLSFLPVDTSSDLFDIGRHIQQPGLPLLHWAMSTCDYVEWQIGDGSHRIRHSRGNPSPITGTCYESCRLLRHFLLRAKNHDVAQSMRPPAKCQMQIMGFVVEIRSRSKVRSGNSGV